MGKLLLALAVALGLAGLSWSFLTFAALAFVAGLGGAPELLLVALLGFLGGALAIAGGVVSLRWERPGAAVVLAAGVVALAGLPLAHLLRPGLAFTVAQSLLLWFLLGWWAYGLVASGAGWFVVDRRRADGGA